MRIKQQGAFGKPRFLQRNPIVQFLLPYKRSFFIGVFFLVLSKCHWGFARCCFRKNQPSAVFFATIFFQIPWLGNQVHQMGYWFFYSASEKSLASLRAKLYKKLITLPIAFRVG